MFAYCNNNPVNKYDPHGNFGRGTIHHQVVNQIYKRYAKSLGMLKNKKVQYSQLSSGPHSSTAGKMSKKTGFVDLVSAATGEVWEVKRSTIPFVMRQADIQLSRYVDKGTKMVDNEYKDMELKRGGTVGTVIESGSFEYCEGLFVYNVWYWDAGNGVILYDYTRKMNEEEVKVPSTSVVEAFGMFGIIIGELLGAGGGIPVLG